MSNFRIDLYVIIAWCLREIKKKKKKNVAEWRYEWRKICHKILLLWILGSYSMRCIVFKVLNSYMINNIIKLLLEINAGIFVLGYMVYESLRRKQAYAHGKYTLRTIQCLSAIHMSISTRRTHKPKKSIIIIDE